MAHRQVATLVAALFVLVQVRPVMANNFGSDWSDPCNATVSSQCVGYLSTTQEFSISNGVGQGVADATRWACTYVYDPVADVGCHEIYPAFYVNVYDGNYGTTWYAWTACSSTATFKGVAADHIRACAPQVFKYDIGHTTAFDTQAERRKIACHELGHTYGLRHSTATGDGNNTCMTTTATNATVTNISAHETNHLNNYYPH